MLKASEHMELSHESEYLVQDHDRPDEDGHLVEGGVAEEGPAPALIERQRDQEVIKGFTTSFAQGAEELGALAKVTCPFLMTSLLLYSRTMISVYYLGRLGSMELAGGVLALAFANVTGFSVIKGLSIGMDPICSQAFGAKRWPVLRQMYLKTVCLLLFTAIAISCLWLNAEPLFLSLRQDLEITQVAKVYLVSLIPELIAQAHLNPLRCFLRCQGITTPFTIASVCGVVLHFPVNYLLAIHFDLGVKGVALALACNTVYLNIALSLYLIFSNSALKPWDRSMYQSISHGWKPLLALAIPTVVSVCLEWWSYEIILFMSGLLDDPKSSLAATGILIQTAGLLYNIPYALSTNLTVRVGNALGAGQASRARRTAIVGIVTAFVCGIVDFIFTIAVRSVWGKLFTDESQVLDLIATALPLLGLCELGNCPQTAACGVLTGTARPTIGARINLYSFYVIGAPVVVLLTFGFKLGYPGLWLGLAAAQVTCTCMLLYILYKTDWSEQVKKAKELTITVEENHESIEMVHLSDHDEVL